MHKWIENFIYKTELSWWMFATAGAEAVAIALLTVSVQSFKEDLPAGRINQGMTFTIYILYFALLKNKLNPLV